MTADVGGCTRMDADKYGYLGLQQLMLTPR